MSKTDSSFLDPKSIIFALINFSKGFSRMSHNKILIRLSDWNTPGWLLQIIVSHLTNRRMIVRYKGAQSLSHPLPSGGPQGDILTIILFLVLVSDSAVGPPPPLPLDAVPGEVIESDTEIRLNILRI